MELQLKQHRHDHILYIEYFSTQQVHSSSPTYIASYSPNVNNFRLSSDGMHRHDRRALFDSKLEGANITFLEVVLYNIVSPIRDETDSTIIIMLRMNFRLDIFTTTTCDCHVLFFFRYVRHHILSDERA